MDFDVRTEGISFGVLWFQPKKKFGEIFRTFKVIVLFFPVRNLAVSYQSLKLTYSRITAFCPSAVVKKHPVHIYLRRNSTLVV